MREMSASAQPSTTFSVPTGVTVSDPAPDAANADPRVGEAQAAAAAAVAPPTPIATAAVAHPGWRLAIGGVGLLIAPTGPAGAIPPFHLKSGPCEDALGLPSVISPFSRASPG